MKTMISSTQLMIFLPIISSVLIYILNKAKFNYIVFVVQGILSVLLYSVWKFITHNGMITYTLGSWSNAIGIELRMDNLTFLFTLMAVIIWWIVLLYAWNQKKDDFKFLFFLMFLEGCFLAFVMANDLFTMFVLIEILTIVSSILIIYKKDGISLKAGLYYLLFNSFGMVIYLFGLIFLYLKVGTLNMTIIKEIITQSNFMELNYSVFQISFACFFASMCVKSALFPVYDWLPRAHTAAPAYVSALLSGLLVKSGVYGLIRILEIFQVDEIYQLMFYLGFLTAVTGFLFAISQKDIKAILAFSTISQIGLIIMSLSSANEIGLTGAYLHIFNHFIFKSILFLGAGIIINEYGHRRITELKGIGIAHPILTTGMVVAILAMTGMPLFIGFISKNMVKLSFQTNMAKWMVQLISYGTLVTYINFSKIFFGEPRIKRKIHPIKMIGFVIMIGICIIAFVTELRILPTFISINHVPSLELLDKIDYIKKASYNSKYLIEYFIMSGVAYLIYKIFVHPNHKFWYQMRHFRMNFQDAIASLLLFIVVIMSFL